MSHDENKMVKPLYLTEDGDQQLYERSAKLRRQLYRADPRTGDENLAVNFNNRNITFYAVDETLNREMYPKRGDGKTEYYRRVGTKEIPIIKLGTGKFAGYAKSSGAVEIYPRLYYR